MPIRLGAGKFREPDVLLYAAEHRDRIGEQFGGPPDLAAEVLSPATSATMRSATLPGLEFSLDSIYESE